MRLCKDCKWCEKPIWFDRLMSGWKYAECHRPELMHDEARYVDGHGPMAMYCSTNRKFEFVCGPKARFWEPRGAPVIPVNDDKVVVLRRR